MVGLLEKNVPVLSMIYAPALEKLYFAIKGGGSYLIEGGELKKLKVECTNSIKDLRLIISRSNFISRHINIAENLGIKKFVSCGSIGVKLGKMAEGEADLYFNDIPYLGEWDLCAPQLILEEAGGFVSDISLNPIKYNTKNKKISNGVIAVSNKYFLGKISRSLDLVD